MELTRVQGMTAPNLAPSAGAKEVPLSLVALAQQLRREFGAPVGVFDLQNGGWMVRPGPPSEAFDAVEAELIASASSQSRVSILPTRDEGSPVWLVLPLRGKGRLLAAVAGFQGPAGSGSSSISWGLPCPDRALLAWGHSILQRLRVKKTEPPNSPSRTSADGPERLVVARLIRRLRISEHPERFQELATNALRATMRVQAVAWVPCSHTEPVVVSGAVAGLEGNGYRCLIPTSPPDGSGRPTIIQNHTQADFSVPIDCMAAVSADSRGAIGWLIAINPLAGRTISGLDAERMQPVASLIATQEINARVYRDLKDLLFGVIRALTAAIDAKDPYTSGHSERVARIAVRLGEALGLSPNQRGDLYLMGLLHDIGKIGVDDAVLKKPGPLTPNEYRQIQAHVEIGVHILSDLKKLNHLLPGVRHHHESLDGTGYPCGLLGDAIPLEARILAVADAYDAMSSTRTYRRRLNPSQIDEVFRRGASIQWDPKIVEALFACRMDIEVIRQKGLGESLQLAITETLGRTSSLRLD
jgi:HD-GYP domain-containing protein (c-di-GMP phosphodiesterase class II)